jgi:hypothetical protein
MERLPHLWVGFRLPREEHLSLPRDSRPQSRLIGFKQLQTQDFVGVERPFDAIDIQPDRIRIKIEFGKQHNSAKRSSSENSYGVMDRFIFREISGTRG